MAHIIAADITNFIHHFAVSNTWSCYHSQKQSMSGTSISGRRFTVSEAIQQLSVHHLSNWK